ncbi:MAG: hypothetical protein ACHQDE_03610, partial [Acidimicrobiia bacterium]
MRRPLVVVTLVMLVVVLAPSGADARTVPAAQWAPKFCSALSTFQQDLARDGDQVDAVLGGDVTSL